MSRLLEEQISEMMADLEIAIAEDSGPENSLPKDLQNYYNDSNKGVKAILSSALSKLVETREHMIAAAEKTISKDQDKLINQFVEKALLVNDDEEAVNAITDEIIEISEKEKNNWAVLLVYANDLTEKFIEFDAKEQEKSNELPDNVIQFPMERIKK